MVLDLSLTNDSIYVGLDVQELAGKPTLLSKPADAIPVIVQNVVGLNIDEDEILLTGAAPIWTYLVVFHALHGRTRRIFYEDGRGQRVLIAAHG